jgi:hypothetical protein
VIAEGGTYIGVYNRKVRLLAPYAVLCWSLMIWLLRCHVPYCCIVSLSSRILFSQSSNEERGTHDGAHHS